MPGKNTEESSTENSHLLNSNEKVRGEACHQTLVLVLRGEVDEESDPYVQELERNDFLAIHVPVLHFEYINQDELRSQLHSCDSISGLIFTSPRTVFAVADIVDGEACIVREKLANKLHFCVGVKTAEKLKDMLGFESTLGDDQATVGSAADLSNYLIANFKSKIEMPLLMPCSSLSKDTLKSSLELHGMQVNVLHVYRTKPNPAVTERVKAIVTDNFDKRIVFVFFSPSGVNSVLPTLREIGIDKFRFAAIGKTTAEHLTQLGCEVLCVADKPNPKSLVEAILRS